VDYPIGLSEGLACSFEVADREGRRGPTVPNPVRIQVLRDAVAKKKTITLEGLMNPGGFNNSSNLTSPPGSENDSEGIPSSVTPPTSGGGLRGKSSGNIGGGMVDGTQEEVTLFYAESWSLFHFLYKTQRAGMEKYLLSYRNQKPFRALSLEMHRKLFQDAFGEDLEVVEAKWLKYVKELR